MLFLDCHIFQRNPHVVWKIWQPKNDIFVSRIFYISPPLFPKRICLKGIELFSKMCIPCIVYENTFSLFWLLRCFNFVIFSNVFQIFAFVWKIWQHKNDICLVEYFTCPPVIPKDNLSERNRTFQQNVYSMYSIWDYSLFFTKLLEIAVLSEIYVT